MNTRNAVLTAVSIIGLVLVGTYYFRTPPVVAPAPIAPIVLATIVYRCGDDIDVQATYQESTQDSSPVEGVPPMPKGSVMLRIGDRVDTLTLNQTISADGGRYATPDDGIVFWNKGRGALFTNGGEVQVRCIEIPKDTGGLPEYYASTTLGYVLRYPTGFALDAHAPSRVIGTGREISSIQLTIPTSVSAGTNLSQDSAMNMESVDAEVCDATIFLEGSTSILIEDADVQYSFASSTGAGAGNRYAEWVYAFPGTSPCLALRYFIHSTVWENYPEGSVSQFDQEALLKQFDSIRKSVVIVP